ncbi:MAG: PTS sugar transporter subunit IIB [Calditrichaeota bacterium]|nr:PTS sugar transporter subunit IIB [Calditrichota bacterium]
MEIQLFRIDDRLIHGQVVIGWASHLNSDTIILCDDSVAENDWEKELYLSIVPESLAARVIPVGELARELKESKNNFCKTIVLVSSPFTVETLLKKGVELNNINIGGIHFKEGRKEYLPYLYLSKEEVNAFHRLMQRGIKFFCQDVPTAKQIPLEKVLEKRTA